MSIRNNKGIGIQLTIMTSFFSAILGLGLFNIAMLFGGSNELTNAVDAGVLNMAKRAQTITVKGGSFDPDERQFAELANDKGQFEVENINRVWGMALLVNLNAQEMGSGNGAGLHADQMFAAAQRISGRLAKQLQDQKNHYASFRQSASANGVRMAGSDSKVVENGGKEWQYAYVDAGQESNIEISAEQLPGKNDAKSLNLVESNGKKFTPGYKSIRVRGRDFVFVPMKEGKQPHRISAVTFNKSKKAPFAPTILTSIVPNAFSASGKVSGGKANGLCSTSCAQINPAKAFKLSMPQGYVKIKLKKNTLKMRFNFMGPEEYEYEFRPGQSFKNRGWYLAGTGVLGGTAYVGNEYLIPTLENCVFTFGDDNYKEMTRVLLQRVREINPEFSEKDIHSAMKSCAVIPGVYDYVLCMDKSKKLKAMTLAQAQMSNPLAATFGEAEGTERRVARERQFARPNFGIPKLRGIGVKLYLPPMAVVNHEGEINWKAGTGYNGCLGELTIKRTTKMDFGGIIYIPI